ncbi:MAG: phosphatase PAP2 family protein [Paludibacteraceae bacterium]
MLEQLIHIDQQWLLAVNGWHAPWADTLMWWVSKPVTWLPLYVLLVWLVIYRFGIQATRGMEKSNRWRQGALNVVLILCGFAVAVGLSDYISSGIIKPWVCRPRPTHEPALQGLVHTVRGYTGGAYGFVSSHAANTMACGLLFSLLYRNKIATAGLMLWVALNCYSRMYLGVHYPGDILCGLLVGAVLAVTVFLLLCRFGVVRSDRSDSSEVQYARQAAVDDVDLATGDS